MSAMADAFEAARLPPEKRNPLRGPNDTVHTCFGVRVKGEPDSWLTTLSGEVVGFVFYQKARKVARRMSS